MRRGLLLLVTVVAGTVVGAVVLASCLPATPAPTPTTTTRATTTTKAPPPTTKRRPRPWRAAPGPRTARSGRARCSPPTTRGTATCRPCPPTPTRPTTSPPSPASAATRHADLAGREYGIPYITGARQPDESCPRRLHRLRRRERPHPRTNAPIERRTAAGDAHVLTVDRDHCKLYELFGASRGCRRWSAASGRCSTSRRTRCTEGWTSADAAGLPIFRDHGALRRGRERSHRPPLRFHHRPRSRRAYLAPGHALGVVVDRRKTCRHSGLRFRLEDELRRVVGYTGQNRRVVLRRSRSTA